VSINECKPGPRSETLCELKISGQIHEHASKVELFEANFNNPLASELRETLRRGDTRKSR